MSASGWQRFVDTRDNSFSKFQRNNAQRWVCSLMGNRPNERCENKLLVRKLGPATTGATLEATIESSSSVR